MSYHTSVFLQISVTWACRCAWSDPHWTRWRRGLSSTRRRRRRRKRNMVGGARFLSSWRREFSDTNFEIGKPCRNCDWMLQSSSGQKSIQSKRRQGFLISKLVSENSLFRLCRSQLRSNHFKFIILTLKPRVLRSFKRLAEAPPPPQKTNKQTNKKKTHTWYHG